MPGQPSLALEGSRGLGVCLSCGGDVPLGATAWQPRLKHERACLQATRQIWRLPGKATGAWSSACSRIPAPSPRCPWITLWLPCLACRSCPSLASLLLCALFMHEACFNIPRTFESALCRQWHDCRDPPYLLYAIQAGKNTTSELLSWEVWLHRRPWLTRAARSPRRL